MKLLIAALAFALSAPLLAQEAPGIFVAVGYGGRRISSRDGLVWENDQRWSDEAKDDDNVLFNVAFGRAAQDRAGRFIAVGGGAQIGHLLSTRDGREWRELPQVKGRVATVAFGDGMFVAGHDAELLRSMDGETFTAGQRLDWQGSVHARRSAFGDTEAGKMFVLIGDVDLAGEPKRVSWRASTTDGVTFAHTEHHTAEARDVAYGSGHFVAVGPHGLIESSHDGQSWVRHETGVADEFSRVVWTGACFLVSGGKTTWTSPDALAWTSERDPIPGSLTWARENVLSLAFSWGGNIHARLTTEPWNKLPIPPGPSLEAIAFGQPD